MCGGGGGGGVALGRRGGCRADYTQSLHPRRD